jgi:hypothetical protein
MNETPRTDANSFFEREDNSPFAPVRELVHADFARMLEKEIMNERKIITELYKALERIAGASKRYFEEQPVSLWEAYDETCTNPFEQAQQALKNAKKLFEPEL